MIEEFEEDIQNFKKGVLKIMKEINDVEKKLNKEKKEYGLDFGEKDNIDLNLVQCFYSAMEMQQDREQEKIESLMEKHENEKAEMRKDFSKQRNWFCGIIATMIIAVFCTLIWFFSNYEFTSYSQDGDGLNNIANETTQRDVIYEPETKDNQTKETE